MDTKPASYTDLLSLRERLDKEHSELLGRFNEVQEKLNAVNLVIALLRGEPMPLAHTIKMQEAASSIQALPAQAQLPATVRHFSESLKGKTQLQALKMIARSHGGQFRTSEARRLLLRAGLIRTPKNAANIIFNVIKKSEQFRRVAPGVYELIEPPSEVQEIREALENVREVFGS